MQEVYIMPYVKTIDRNQMYMTSLDMMVDPDSIARIIDAFVDSLDLTGMGFTNTNPSSEGRPAYNPGSLLKLYLYGHRNNMRSSRKLQKACHVNIEAKWLMKGAEPDFRTISDFRKDNVSRLKDVFLEFNKRFEDLMTGYLSVDGTKIIACNAKSNNFTSSKIDDRIAWLKGHIEEYLRQMDKQDREDSREETTDGSFTSEQLEAKLAEARERLEKYERYREYMEQNNLSQISLTDADARLMKNRNGFTVSHNVQTAVESNTHMIADFTVSSDPTDYGQLESTLHGLKEQRPHRILEATADKGYQSEEDMARCLENGILPNVILPDGQDSYTIELPYEPCEDPHPESVDPAELSKCLRAGIIPDAYKSHISSIQIQEKNVLIRSENEPVARSPFQDEEEMLSKAAEGYFVRDPARNIVYCPAGEILRQNMVTKKDRIRYINKMACRRCPYRDKCYKGRKGFKEVEFNKDEFCKPNGVWQKSEGKKPVFQKRRVKREKRMMVTITLVPDRRKMANRMCLSEHPFGSIKRFQDSSYFLLRGNRKVTGEFALFSLTYNMQRAINLLGFEEVMRKIIGYLFFFTDPHCTNAENAYKVLYLPVCLQSLKPEKCA